MTKSKTTPGKIDEKQKTHYIDLVLKENPELSGDPLQLHYIEQMVESYLFNPDDFNRKTTELIKKEKKNPPADPTRLPDEIVCISKVEAEKEEEKEGIKDVVVSPQKIKGGEEQC